MRRSLPARRPWNGNAIALFVPALLFGFLVAAQWRTQELRTASELDVRHSLPLTGAARSLQIQQDELKSELATLRAQLDQINLQALSQSAAAKDLGARIEDLQRRAGLVAETGEGIVAYLEEVRPTIPRETEKPVCHSTDLIDIVNAGWRGGARAIAVNTERIVATSSVYCVGSTTIVNGTVISPPFAVTAIGVQAELAAVFDDPQQLRDLRRPREGIAFRVTRGVNLHVPAYDGALAVRFATAR